MPSAWSITPPAILTERRVKPSGSDDYTRLQAALDRCILDGKEFIIDGMCRTSASVAATAGWPKGLLVRGANPASGLVPYSSAADGIKLLHFKCPVEDRGYDSDGLAVRDLFLQGRGTDTRMTGGCALEIDTAWKVAIENILTFFTYDGIVMSGGDVTGTAIVSMNDCDVHGFVRNGVWLKGMTEVRLSQIFVDAIPAGGGGGFTTGSIGLLVESRDALNVMHFDCVGAEIGCKIKPNGTTLNINGGMWFWNAMMDTGGTGWVIDGTGENLDEIEMHGCWAGYNSGRGVVIKGSALKGVRWYGGIIQANAGGGYEIESAHASDAQHVLENVQVLRNAGFGAKLASGVGGVKIRNSRFTNAVNYGLSFGDQEYGIELGGSHQGLEIVGNDMRGNDTAAITGDYAHSTNRVRDNLGVNPKGNITAPSVPATGVAYTNASAHDCTVFVAGGTVTAIAIGGVATGMTSGPIRVPAGQTITLTYSSAPTWTWFGD